MYNPFVPCHDHKSPQGAIFLKPCQTNSLVDQHWFYLTTSDFVNKTDWAQCAPCDESECRSTLIINDATLHWELLPIQLFNSWCAHPPFSEVPLLKLNAQCHVWTSQYRTAIRAHHKAMIKAATNRDTSAFWPSRWPMTAYLRANFHNPHHSASFHDCASAPSCKE